MHELGTLASRAAALGLRVQDLTGLLHPGEYIEGLSVDSAYDLRAGALMQVDLRIRDVTGGYGLVTVEAGNGAEARSRLLRMLELRRFGHAG